MTTHLPQPSKAARITGWVLSILPAGLFFFSASGKFMLPPEAAKGFEHLGWPTSMAIPLGVLEVTCVIVYLIPRTAVLGAILLAGYLGGAIATHVRIGEPWFIQAALGIVLWLGIYLREPRLRALIPLRQ